MPAYAQGFITLLSLYKSGTEKELMTSQLQLVQLAQEYGRQLDGKQYSNFDLGDGKKLRFWENSWLGHGL